MTLILPGLPGFGNDNSSKESNEVKIINKGNLNIGAGNNIGNDNGDMDGLQGGGRGMGGVFKALGNLFSQLGNSMGGGGEFGSQFGGNQGNQFGGGNRFGGGQFVSIG